MKKIVKTPILPDGTKIESFEVNYDVIDTTWNSVSPRTDMQIFNWAELNGESISEERAKEIIEFLRKFK